MSPFRKTDHPDAFVPSLDHSIGEVFIRHLGLFGKLSEADRQALLALKGRIGVVKRGDDLLHTGDKPTNVVAVLTGLLQRYTLDTDGNRQIHSFYLGTDIPSLESMHLDVMDSTLGAVTTSRVALIAHADMFTLFSAHPNIGALCWRETLVQAAIFREWLTRNSQKLAHAQLAHLFCEMMTRSVSAGISDGQTMDLPITQQDMADALGMSVVHVNRSLQMLRSSGQLGFKDGMLTILDFDGLADLAGFDAAYLHLPAAAPAS